MKTNRKSGMALAVALIFMVVCALVSAAYFQFVRSARAWSQRDLYRETAFSLAEAAVEVAAQNVLTNWTLTTTFTASGTLGGYGYAYSITPLSNMYSFAIDGTGVCNGVKRAVHMKRVEIPSWAKYAWWVHVNGAITLIYGDQFNGWAHSDSKLSFSTDGSGRSATFLDHLSTLTNNYNHNGSTSTNPNPAGVSIAFPFMMNSYQGKMADVKFPELKAKASFSNLLGSSLVLTGATAITIRSNKAIIANAKRGWTTNAFPITGESIIYVADAPTAGAGSVGDVQIGGTLKERLTVVAEGSFKITNHLAYAVDPQSNPSATNSLGLVAGGDITVMTNAPKDLKINAAMMATGTRTNSPGSFGVQNHDTRPVSGSGTLNVYGSIVQDTRGAVGTASGSGTISTGFLKNYVYDKRFLSNPPPYYPRVATSVNYFGWWDEAVQ